MDLEKLLDEIEHEEDKKTLEPELQRFSTDIFELLMERKPKGGYDSIPWVKFKNYRSVCAKRIEIIKKEINLFNIEIKTERTKSLLTRS